MRKVLFKTWIPRRTEKVDSLFGGGKIEQKIQGTGCWSEEYTEFGMFHQWAASYEEFETGAGNFTVAIIERPDGTIYLP